MSCWNGPYPDEPEDEREAMWEDSGDEDECDPQPWRGDAHPLDADYWCEDWPGEMTAGPEYWLYLNDAQRDGEEEG